MLRRLQMLCAAFCLLAPAGSALAVDLHERLAAHHEVAHHAVGHGHSHGADGHHVHHEASRHLHDASVHHLPSSTAADDHHDHESRSLGAGRMTTRDPGPGDAHLVAKVVPEPPTSSCARTLRSSSLSPAGVGPPGKAGLVPYLHCSLLI